MYIKVVSFCHSAPKAHMAKVTDLADTLSARCRMAGMSHSGP